MKKNDIIKYGLKLVASLSLMVAVSEASAGCPLMLYQPKVPDEVKKLRQHP